MDGAKGSEDGDRRHRLAWVVGGLLATTALALSSWLVGADPDSMPRLNVGLLWHDPAAAVGAMLWVAGLATIGVAWWRARGLSWRVRQVWAVAALWSLPLLAAPPLASRDVYAYTCQGATFLGGLDPYRFGPMVLPCPWIDSVTQIWQSARAPYGPLWIAASSEAVDLSGGNQIIAVSLLRLTVLAGALLIAGVLPSLARTCGMPADRAAWLGLASPVFLIHGVSGGHNDVLMIGFALLGVHLLTRGRSGWAGVAFGLAVAVKATALVVVPFAILPLLRDRTFRQLLRRSALPLVTLAGAFAAVMTATGLGIGWIAGLGDSGRVTQWISVPTLVGIGVGAVSRGFGPDLTHYAVLASRTLGWIAMATIVVGLWWRAWRATPLRPAGTEYALRHAAYALTAVVLLSPVIYGWYLLWPLALVAVTRQPRPVYRIAAAGAVLIPLANLPDGQSNWSPVLLAGLVWYAIARIRANRAGRRALLPVVDLGFQIQRGRRRVADGGRRPAHREHLPFNP